jgi:hypothetical protein
LKSSWKAVNLVAYWVHPVDLMSAFALFELHDISTMFILLTEIDVLV